MTKIINQGLLLTKSSLMKSWQKIWAGPSPPPHLDKIQKNSSFFHDPFPYEVLNVMTAKFGNMWNSLSILPGASNWTPHQLRFKSNTKTCKLCIAQTFVFQENRLNLMANYIKRWSTTRSGAVNEEFFLDGGSSFKFRYFFAPRWKDYGSNQLLLRYRIELLHLEKQKCCLGNPFSMWSPSTIIWDSMNIELHQISMDETLR